MRACFLLCYLFLSFSNFAATTVTTVGKQKPADASHDYFINLLRLALNESSTEYGEAVVKTVPHPSQERVIKLLGEGNFYDVIWSGSSETREKKLLKVAFPLFKGGLGWRGLVIKRQDIEKFSAFNTLNDLSEVIACQGSHWPDADILEQAGLTIYRVGHFDAMLQMVELQRCDYLTLSIFEGQAELDLVQKSFPNLIFFQQLIIQYPLTMNFFVNINNVELASRLKLGLKKLHDSGSFKHYMKNHPLTKSAFPLSKFKKATVITLQNKQYHSIELEHYGLQWPKKEPH